MALPPTIPTSFAPRAEAPRKFNSNYSGVFVLVSYLVLGAAVLAALGVFLYDRILTSEESSKQQQLKTAVAAIDSSTLQGFIRLRDRLDSGNTLLGGHAALSRFFQALGPVLPTTVQFKSLSVKQNDAGAFDISGAGAAKSFNALAAASGILGKNGVKNAIFSGVSIEQGSDKKGTVSFQLAATADAALTAFVVATSSRTTVSTTAATATTTTTSSSAATSTKTKP